MKKKVYCKNCRFQVLASIFGADYCDRKNSYAINKFTGEYINGKVIRESFFTNTHGTCSYYQKKWWKFWL